jgi:hypothetical protein
MPTTYADPFDDTPEGAPPVPRTMASIAAHEVRRIRSSHQYQALRAQFRNDEEHRWIDGKMGAPCWLCGGDIDYRLQYPHPYSWSLDHAVPVHHQPELLMDVNNFRSSHHDCNQQRGTDEPGLDIGVPSEIW